ncbi:MAG: hypothetical protein IPK21_15475 [Haliscomenobacter sp.]|nr:hypothetical protein [Haliscomenobacter sp.]
MNVETGKIDSKCDFNLNPNGNVVADLGELAGKILIDIKAAGLKFDAPSYPFKLGPLSVSGHHNLPTQSKVWLLLHDGKLYYLQNARLNLESSGNWTNHGVNVGHGIKSIHAVLVTDEGDLLFQQKIANSDYSGFSILPAGSRELDSANLIQQ